MNHCRYCEIKEVPFIFGVCELCEKVYNKVREETKREVITSLEISIKQMFRTIK